MSTVAEDRVALSRSCIDFRGVEIVKFSTCPGASKKPKCSYP